MEEIEDVLEDEELDDEAEEAEELGQEAAPPAPAADGDEVDSIDLIVKKEARAEEEEAEDETALGITGEERGEERLGEPLTVKVVPPQEHEFICRKCYLVKHRSQLKDKSKMLCRDCA